MSRSFLIEVLMKALALAALTASLAADEARACGPEFPPTLLDDRQHVLTNLPDEPFFVDARHLLDGLLPPDPPVVVVSGEPEGCRARGGPLERALYDDGAVAFLALRSEKAESAFRALLALPPDQRRHRSTWAAFMLGRLNHHEMWAETRALAAADFVDELGLAAASFGEEAQHHLGTNDPAASIVDAVTLYARQARAGDEAGAVSLLVVVRDVLDEAFDQGDPARLHALERAPIGQRLLAAYAFARGDERPEKSAAVTARLVRNPKVEWPDRLAAALYRQGQFVVATRLLTHAQGETPLALWVRAKLALHAGDVDAARGLLAQASRSFPTANKARKINDDDDDGDGWWHPLAPTLPGRVLGEEAILALARRDYVLALDKLLQAKDWWQDAAFVAERVLTVDELVAFVDARAPGKEAAVDDPWSWGQPNSQANALRHLLARRLVRDGRPQDALRYLDDPALRLQLVTYVTALQQARDADDDVTRAELLFQAALITRRQGMELRGTELAPDWFVWGGSYDASESWDENGEVRINPVPVPSALPAGEVLVDVDEARRAGTSRPEPDERYHYRRVAMHLAEDAAGHVPPRSQAYAALLCKASRFALRHPDDVSRLWDLYVKNGAIVDFVSAFGSYEIECPEPDFAALRPQPEPVRSCVVDVGVVVLPAALTALGLLWLRRRRQLPAAAPAFHAPP
ncbi:MAG: hypothetical protein Q8O67_19330 [Deltaproteobacteria bacterium]|nr:hypothetical protein [Deltaproteobacteria bacterium]